MFNNVALDVFIGLSFIFLIYSLLASIIMEFIAHYMHLRPRLLMKALRRMLEDNPAEIFGVKSRITAIDFFSDVKESFKRYFMPFKNLPFLKRFYYHPTIKYLGESRSSSKPSYMHASNFSQTIMQLFRGDTRNATISQLAAIEHYLFKEAEQIIANYERYKHWVVNEEILKKHLNAQDVTFESLIDKIKKVRNPLRYKTRNLLLDQLVKEIQSLGSLEEVENFRVKLAPLLIQVKERKISADTLKHFQNLFIDSQNNLDNFRQRLEIWFDETMERTTGWYKRQTQVILLTLGFFIAVWANVDAIKIYKTLAKDKKVRDQMVNMAIQSQEKYAGAIDTIRQRRTDSTRRSGDSVIVYKTDVLTTGDSVLDKTYKLLQEDMSGAENILGLGWCSSDSCKRYKQLEATRDSLKRELAVLRDENRDYKAALENTGSDPDSPQKQRTIDSINLLIKKINSIIPIHENNIAALSATVNSGYKRYKERWDPGTSDGWLSVVGWLITALAISLGAPFWFDMLNKLVRVRSAGAKVTNAGKDRGNATNPSSPNSAPLTVNVNSNTNSGEEAVG